MIEDACRGIGLALPDGTDTIVAARNRLEALGVRFVESATLA